MKKIILLIACAMGFMEAGAQQLYINELSQGTGGAGNNKEYVEMVVSGTRTCTDSTLDIRGLMFDDNPGWYGTTAYNAGFFRFAPINNWAAVPYGSLIVIYNSDDKNTYLPADDPYDLNHDYVYIIPDTSVVLQSYSSAPASASATYVYPGVGNTGWGNTGTWAGMLVSANPGDAFHIVSPSNPGPNNALHSMAWGNMSSITNAQLQFSGGMGGNNVANTGSAPMSASSWTIGNATASASTTNETPGAGNSTANTAWIAAMRVQVAAAPATPAAPSGPAGICPNSTNTYTVTAVSGASSYIWTLPTGWTGTSSTNSISATAGSSGGSISVKAVSACGQQSASSPSFAVTVSSPVTPAVTITANPGTTICQGTSVTFTAVPVNGGTSPSYQWLRNSTNVGTNSATFTSTALSNGDTIRVVLTSSIGCLTAPTATSNSLIMTVNTVPAIPAAITGSTAVCINNTNLSYSVPAVATATSYTWTLPSGWSGSSTSNSITVTASATTGSGTISVTAINGCGPSPVRTLSVAVGTIPPVPGPISGPLSPCANTPATYSVANISTASGYTWTAPAGFTGGTSGNASITYSAGSVPGNISVYASNICGNSAPVNLAVAPNIIPATPGAISGAASICANTSQNYSVATVAGASAYTWTLPAGWSGATSGSGINVTAGTSGGTISVVASSVCGTSSPSSLQIAVSNNTSASVSVTANPGPNVCAGIPVTFTAVPTASVVNPTYTWLRNGQPVAQGPTYVSNNHSNGDVFSVSMTATSPCGNPAVTASTNSITLNVTPSVTPGININTVPNTTFCRGNVIAFTANAVAGGNFPGYQWYLNGNPIPGATSPTYTSTSLVTSDTLQVVLTSSATCAVPQSASSNKVGVTVQALVTPTVSVSASPGTTITPGTPVTFTANVTGGGNNPGLQWYKNGAAIPGATGSSYTSSSLQANDAITVKLQSNAPCVTQPLVTSSPSVIQFASTGVAQTGAGAVQVQLFPNPNNGRFSIRVSGMQLAPGEELRLEVYNAVGQRLLLQTVRPVKADWEQDVQLEGGLANGTYLLRLSSGKNRYAAPFSISQ